MYLALCLPVSCYKLMLCRSFSVFGRRQKKSRRSPMGRSQNTFSRFNLRPSTVFKGHDARCTCMFLRCHSPTFLSVAFTVTDGWRSMSCNKQTNKKKCPLGSCKSATSDGIINVSCRTAIMRRGEISSSGVAADAFRSAVRGVQTRRRWRRRQASLG